MRANLLQTRVIVPLAALAALLAALWLCGCGVRQLTKGDLMPPEVRLKGLNLQPPTQQGWPLTVALAVHNPNPMTVRVLGYDYNVRLAGQQVAQGVGNQAITLPAQGETTVAVPVILNIRNLPGLLPQLLDGRKVPVDIAGGLRLPQTLGLRVPFRFREELTLQEGMEELRPFLGK